MSEASERQILRRVPNLISALRILMVPAWLFVAHTYRNTVLDGAPQETWRHWAFAILLALGASDLVDGWIARRFDATSEHGAVLDAVADKLAQVSMYTYLALFGAPAFFTIPFWFIGLLILRDVLLATGVITLWRRGQSDFPHRWHGKLSSVLLFVLLVWVGVGEAGAAFEFGLYVVAVVIVSSTARYVVEGLDRARDRPPRASSE